MYRDWPYFPHEFESMDSNPLCPLTRCILEANTEALKRILRERTKNSTPLQPDRRGWTALHFAATKDEWADCLKLLLSNKDTLGLNLDAETHRGETALLLACVGGCFNNCRILLNSKCNPEIQQNSGYAALHIASMRGHADIVSQLLAHGLNPNCQVTYYEVTPLHCASRRGHLDVVRVLMTSKRTNVNICDREGELPLHAACHTGSLEIVRILVEADRNMINSGCNSGFTPLMGAIGSRNVECVKYLLDQKANVNLCTVRHRTTLQFAFKGGVEEISELVLQATCPNCIFQQFILEIELFLSNDVFGELDSLMSSAVRCSSPESFSLFLESGMPKCVLETPYIWALKNYVFTVWTPLALLFFEVRSTRYTQEEVDKRLRLLLQHNITHLYEFYEMFELKEHYGTIYLFAHPFTDIFEGPWSPVQCDHYLSTLFEYGITTDYSLECDVHYDSPFLDLDVKVLKRFYQPVIKAMKKDSAEFIELLLIHSAILEPSHLWNYLQYQHRGRDTMERESSQNVVTYLIDLGVVVGASNLPLYPFGGTIKCPNLQQLCRQTIRKHLRDFTIQDNLENFKQKINALPLPNSLKNYLNFKRR